jgi:hypothetical protein
MLVTMGPPLEKPTGTNGLRFREKDGPMKRSEKGKKDLN